MSGATFRIGEIALVHLCEYHGRLRIQPGMHAYLFADVQIESIARMVRGQSAPHHQVRSLIDHTVFNAPYCCLRRRPPVDPAYLKFRDQLVRDAKAEPPVLEPRHPSIVAMLALIGQGDTP